MPILHPFQNEGITSYANWFNKKLPSIKNQLLELRSAEIAEKVINQLIEQLFPLEEVDTSEISMLLLSNNRYEKIRTLFQQLCSYGVTFNKSTTANQFTQLVQGYSFDVDPFLPYTDMTAPSILSFVASTPPVLTYEKTINTPTLSVPTSTSVQLSAFVNTGTASPYTSSEWAIAEDEFFQKTLHNLNITPAMQANLNILQLTGNNNLTYPTSPLVDNTDNTSPLLLVDPPAKNIGTFTGSALRPTGLTHTEAEWLIYTDSSCTELLHRIHVKTGNRTKLVYNIQTYPLVNNTTYYIRLRYRSKEHGSYWSKLSAPFTFVYTGIQTPAVVEAAGVLHTTNQPAVATPTITTGSPITVAPMIVATAFAVTTTPVSHIGIRIKTSPFLIGTGFTDTHVHTTYALASDHGFTLPLYTRASNTDLIEHVIDDPTLNLQLGRVYYLKVQHTGYNYGDSAWSAVYPVTIMLDIVPAPILLASHVAPDAATVVRLTLQDMFSGGTYQLTDTIWEIAEDALFTQVNYTVTTNRSSTIGDFTALNVPLSVSLPNSRVLYWRARYRATALDGTVKLSAWSSHKTFQLTTLVHKPSVVNHTAGLSISPHYIHLVTSTYALTGQSSPHAKTELIFTNKVTGVATTVLVTSGNLTNPKIVQHTQLRYNTNFTVKVRYISASGIPSEYSDEYPFNIPASIVQPAGLRTISSSLPNVFVKLTANAMQTVGAYDEHTASRWIVAGSSNMSNVLYTSNWTTDLLSHDIPVMSTLKRDGTLYYATVQYQGRILGESLISAIHTFSVVPGISTPSILRITPCTTLSCFHVLTASAFHTSVSGLTHAATQWQFANTDTFGSGNILHDVERTTTLTSITMDRATFPLTFNSPLYVRLRYKGNDNTWSMWSTPMVVNTANTVYSPENFQVIPTNTSGVIKVAMSTAALRASNFPVTHTGTSWAITSTNNPPDSNNTLASKLNSTTDKTQTTFTSPSGVQLNVQYYAWVAHHSAELPVSAWRNLPFTITAGNLDYVRALSYTVYSNNTHYVNLISNAFVPPLTGNTHASSRRQIATNSTFLPGEILYDKTSTTNLVSFPILKTDLPTFAYGTTYYWRVLYTDNTGQSTNFSPSNSFIVNTAFVKPAITDAQPTGSGFVALTSTPAAFTTNLTTHTSSRWSIRNSTGIPIWDSGFVTSLTAFTVPVHVDLPYNVPLSATVTYRSSTLTADSLVSDPFSFTITKALAKPDITSVAPRTGTLNVFSLVSSTAFVPVTTGTVHAKSHYQIRETVGGPVIRTIVIAPGVFNLTVTSANFPGFIYGKAYFIEVAYESSIGELSPYSDVRTLMTHNPLTAPTITSHTADYTTANTQTLQLNGSNIAAANTPVQLTAVRYEIYSNAALTTLVDSGSINTATPSVTITNVQASPTAKFVSGQTYYARIAYNANHYDAPSPWSTATAFVFTAPTVPYHYTYGDLIGQDIVVRVEPEINRVLLLGPASVRRAAAWHNNRSSPHDLPFVTKRVLRTVPADASNHGPGVEYQEVESCYNVGILNREGASACAQFMANANGYRLPTVAELKNCILHPPQRALLDSIDTTSSEVAHMNNSLVRLCDQIAGNIAWTLEEGIELTQAHSSGGSSNIAAAVGISNTPLSSMLYDVSHTGVVIPVKELPYLHAPVIGSYVPTTASGYPAIRLYLYHETRYTALATPQDIEIEVFNAANLGTPIYTGTATTATKTINFTNHTAGNTYTCRIRARATVNSIPIASEWFTRTNISPTVYNPEPGDLLKSGDLVFHIGTDGNSTLIAPYTKRIRSPWWSNAATTWSYHPSIATTPALQRTAALVALVGADAVAAKYCLDLGYILPEDAPDWWYDIKRTNDYYDPTDVRICGRKIDLVEGVTSATDSSILNMMSKYAPSNGVWTTMHDYSAAHVLSLTRHPPYFIDILKGKPAWVLPIKRVPTAGLEPHGS